MPELQIIHTKQSTGRYWICTYSAAVHPGQPHLVDFKDGSAVWLLGQQEIGEGGFLHWQYVVGFKKTVRLSHITKVWPGGHYELSRSSAADAYVRKEESRVAGTEFEEVMMPF